MGLFEMRLRGLHNVLNALAVIGVAHHLGIDFDAHVRPALREYVGVDRRMQLRYEGHNVVVLDDYAHHPNEVAAVLSTLRDEYVGRRIVAVLQCHQASRTRRNLRAFAEALKSADRVFVPDIYIARDSEEDQRAVHALDLVRTAANRGVNATYVESLSACADALVREVRAGDLVVTMGASSVWEVSRDFADRLLAFDREVIAPR
jgi:UDP-N-acetylmuramate--alanine ligase